MNTLMDIVFIDDDEISCYISRMLLKDMQLPHHVHCITDSRKAIKYLEKKCPKQSFKEGTSQVLAFLDTHMPMLDGFELLEELEQCSTIDRDKIHVVLLSAMLTDRDIEKASKYNLLGVHHKPLTKELVQQIIASMPASCH